MSEQPTDAPERLRAAASWTAFATGYLAAYFGTTAIPTPLPWYFPLERRFAILVHPLGLAADFYGRVLFCLLAGALAWLAARTLFRSWEGPRLERALRTLAVWCAAILIFTAGLYIYLLAFRIPFPAPLPPGYVPR